MNTCLSDKSRPWEYIQPGVIRTSCDVPMYVSRVSNQDQIQRQQDTLQRVQQSTIIGSTVAGTIANASSITSTIKGQTQSTVINQSQQYLRPDPICVPADVRAFIRDTQNMGVSVMPFRFQDCKGLF